MTIERPIFESVSLADGLKWSGGGGWCYQEKLDGIWHIRPVGTDILAGELVGDLFTPFDIIAVDGQDIRSEPLSTRLAILRSIPGPQIEQGNGGEFLETVLARGGEGIVAKPWDSPFGKDWVKCKREETHDCRVTEIHLSKMSAHLELNGEDCGWLAILSVEQFALAAPGKVAEVKCHSRHPSGKLREPVFVRWREDKQLQL